MGFVIKAIGAGIVLMGLAAVVVVASPAAREQSGVQLRSQILGGSQIGVTVRDVEQSDVSRQSLPVLAGVVVEEVRSDGPAAEAGIRAGDVIIRFDGERVRSARHFARLVDETPEGREVAVAVIRDSREIEVEVAPAPAAGLRAFNFEPLRQELRQLDFSELRGLDNFEFNLPERSFALTTPGSNVYSIITGGRARLGVGVQDLTEQLAEYFGAEDGVLITSVDDDSPAAAAGLRAGDVITSIGDESIDSAGDLRRELSQADGEVSIGIVRDRQAMTVTAEIEGARIVRRIVR
jgi:serine protease Do